MPILGSSNSAANKDASPYLTYPLRAEWAKRLQWILSSLPCFWLSVWLGSKTPVLFSFFLYCMPPCCSWAAHFPSAFWYPWHCCLTVTVVLHSKYMANPSPSSYFYFCADSFNFCPTEYVIIRHDVRPSNFQNFSEAFELKSVQLLIVVKILVWCHKYWQNGDKILWLSRKHCGKRRNCSWRAISSFPTMFSKAVCCRCVKMSIEKRINPPSPLPRIDWRAYYAAFNIILVISRAGDSSHYPFLSLVLENKMGLWSVFHNDTLVDYVRL